MHLSRYTVVIDACVLYPAPLRDLLVELAGTELFRAKWTEKIHDEWTTALLANRADLNAAQLRRTCDLMNRSVMDCLVSGYEDLVAALHLPDMNDRHVLAAAIRCSADAIITFNFRDFPSRILAQYDIEAQHPDDFVHHQFGIDQGKVISAAQKCRARLKQPRMTGREYLAMLERQALPRTIGALEPFVEII